jgi:hypothetical protein
MVTYIAYSYKSKASIVTLKSVTTAVLQIDRLTIYYRSNRSVVDRSAVLHIDLLSIDYWPYYETTCATSLKSRVWIVPCYYRYGAVFDIELVSRTYRSTTASHTAFRKKFLAYCRLVQLVATSTRHSPWSKVTDTTYGCLSYTSIVTLKSVTTAVLQIDRLTIYYRSNRSIGGRSICSTAYRSTIDRLLTLLRNDARYLT